MSDVRDPADILTERTDDRWLAYWPEFIDLQVSEHARGDTEDEARRNLLTRSGPDYQPAITPEIGPEPPPM
jgi:hypothetical protein